MARARDCCPAALHALRNTRRSRMLMLLASGSPARGAAKAHGSLADVGVLPPARPFPMPGTGATNQNASRKTLKPMIQNPQCRARLGVALFMTSLLLASGTPEALAARPPHGGPKPPNAINLT